MKILFLSHQANFMYGGEKVTLEMMRVLRERHEVFFASPPGPYLEAAKQWATTIPISSKEFSRDWKKLPNFVMSLSNTHRELREFITTEKIDAIHATSLKAMVYAWMLGMQKRVQVVWHHHNILSRGVRNALWLHGIAKAAAKILVPSEATKRALTDIGIQSEKVEVIYNGFDQNHWRARPARTDKSRITAVIVGEISRRKGSHWIHQIVAKVQTAVPGTLQMLVAGEATSDPDFGAAVERKNRRWIDLGLLKFIGRQENVPALLQKADVLLVPSEQDPLPTVIIEAFFSGVPVIATPVGGIPEMVDDGENGFLCDTADKFGSKILLLKEDLALWKSLSQNARTKAEQVFSAAHMGEQIDAIYNEIAGPQGRPHTNRR